LKRYVLDSYALIAYFTGEEAGKPVVEVLKKTLDGDAESFLCVVNWGEVYYITLRENGLEQAETFRKLIEEYPIEIVNVDQDLTLEAARFKASNKMSYADTFAAALAKIKKAELVTGDKEFKSVEGEVKILWL
jgi:ribonuclease VapC